MAVHLGVLVVGAAVIRVGVVPAEVCPPVTVEAVESAAELKPPWRSVSQRPERMATPIALQPSGRQRRPSALIAVALASPSSFRIAGTPTKTSTIVPPTQTTADIRCTMRRTVIMDAGYRPAR